MMKKHSSRLTVFLIVVAFCSPLVAFAQTDSGGVTDQIQSLVSQITSLEAQLQTLVSSVVGTTTDEAGPPRVGPSNSSAQQFPNAGGMQVMGACPQFDRDLSMGSSGSDVSDLQSVLVGQGFLSGTSTGYFGALTARALARFQSSLGIASSTGVLGPLTRNLLRNRCGSGMGIMGSTTASTSPNGTMMPPFMGPNGTSTMQQPPPCPQGAGNAGNAAAIALALFVPHAMYPGMMPPCPRPSVSGEMQQQ